MLEREFCMDINQAVIKSNFRNSYCYRVLYSALVTSFICKIFTDVLPNKQIAVAPTEPKRSRSWAILEVNQYIGHH